MVMTRIFLRARGWCAAAVVAVAPVLVPSALAAQGPERTEWRVQRGTDTLATERYTRGPGSLEGTVSVRGGAVFVYRMETRPDGAVARATLDVHAIGAAEGAPPMGRMAVAFQGDSAVLERSGGAGTGTSRLASAAGAVPFVNLSAGVLEQAVSRARALGGDTATVPLFVVLGGTTLPARVVGARTGEASITVSGVALRLALDPEGRVLGGWVPSQGVVFERTLPAGGRLPAGAREVADYSAPPGAPYTAEEVRVPTPGGFALAGTLTLPRGGRGPVPAVVLVSGSGPQDRDSRIAGVPGYRPFAQMADTLGRRGIAVLRLDDRGVGASGGDPSRATSADFADDVRAALAYLRTRPEVDARRLAVAGHSEGGMIAPMVAADDPALAAVVLLAGTSRTGREINAMQNRQAIEASGLTAAQRDSVAATVPARVDSLAAAIPWFRFWLDHDPLPTLRRVRQPVLVLHGATDHQVEPAQAAEIAAALRAAGNRDVTVRVFPGINHLFLPDPSGLPGGYGSLPSSRVPAEVLGLMADWLAARLGR
jgi:dienelactone hydrolase